MVKTYGLTHVALAVRDVDRASAFYRSVFGAVEVYRKNGFVQLQTRGARDVIVLEQKSKGAGKSGGIAHFGFRLQRPKDIDAAARAVKKAGGKVKDKGQFVPGEPYVFATDPESEHVNCGDDSHETVLPCALDRSAWLVGRSISAER